MKVLSQCLELITLAASRHFFTVHCHLDSGADHARTGYRSSGLATKKLSAVVASGASTGKSEEGSTLISSTIPECLFSVAYMCF